MILVKTIFKELGFYSNHPDKLMCKWHKTLNINGNECEFTLIPNYTIGNTDLDYQLLVNIFDDNGNIKKKIDISFIKTTEELNQIITFCKI